MPPEADLQRTDADARDPGELRKIERLGRVGVQTIPRPP
jgi:hypothetical protein